MARIGLVLGAGGLPGEAFHRGVLRALWDVAGWDARTAEVVVGTSAGALVGASLRRPDPDAAVLVDEEITSRARLLPGLRAVPLTVVRPWRARPGVLASSLVPAGRRSTDWIVEGVRSRYGGQWADRPLWLCTVRCDTGERVVFGRPGAPAACVASAVAASCAIPGYFRPVIIGGIAYVDGGAHSPTNADLLASEGLDLVLVSSPMSVVPAEVRPKIDLHVRLFFHRYLIKELAAIRRRGTPAVAFEPGAAALRAIPLNALNARHVDVVEEHAYESVSRSLQRPAAGPLLDLLADTADEQTA
jgi:NTE family protein